jgi:HEAT repeat protein
LNDKNSNYKIKLASAEALGKIGDKNAFDILGRIATDENEESAYIKESAVTALGMLGDERAIDVFSSIMNTKQIFREKFSFLKEKIMEAMGKFDISRNKKALEIITTSLYDNNPAVRISAIEALMNSDIIESFDLIYGVFKIDDNIEVKKNALVAMYNIKDDIKILEDIIRGDYTSELKDFAIETIKEIEENNEY